MKITVTEEISREIEVFPCIKCGSDDIEIYNCGYSSFNCAGGKCKKCGHAIETGAHFYVKDSTLIKAWNSGNNPDNLIAELEEKRQEINAEITRLRKAKRKLQTKTI